MGFIEVESATASAAPGPSAARPAKSAAPKTAWPSPGPLAARSALLVTKFLGPCSHLVTIHVEDVATGR